MKKNFIHKLKARKERLFTRHNWIVIAGLTRANFKASDYGTVMGILWSLINPAVMLAVMYFIFKGNFGIGIKAYPLYIFIGIISVNFFIATTTYMAASFPANRSVFLNSTIPRESLIASKLSTLVFKFLIDLSLCFIASVLYGFFSWRNVFLAAPLIISYTAFVVGIGALLAILYCLVKDVCYIWTLATRLLYFITPVFFPLDRIPPAARTVVYFGNPLTPFIFSFRGILMNSLILTHYLYCIALGLGVFIFCYCIFLYFEDKAMEWA